MPKILQRVGKNKAISMKDKFLLLLVILISFAMYAQIPDAARVKLKNHAEDEASSTLSIATLQRIRLLVNNQNLVQAVFVFDDKDDIVFDNVDAIQFVAADIADIDYNDPITTAIEPPSDVTISLYPNPATEMVHIFGMSEDSHAAVFDINGRRICDIDGSHTTMDVSGWVSGTYLIRIDNRIFKLIKQ